MCAWPNTSLLVRFLPGVRGQVKHSTRLLVSHAGLQPAQPSRH